jgi:hypothetical protein
MVTGSQSRVWSGPEGKVSYVLTNLLNFAITLDYYESNKGAHNERTPRGLWPNPRDYRN